MIKRYDLFLNGEVKEGYNKVVVIRKLARAFDKPFNVVERSMREGGFRVKKNIDRTQLIKYIKFFSDIGAIFFIKEKIVDDQETAQAFAGNIKKTSPPISSTPDVESIFRNESQLPSTPHPSPQSSLSGDSSSQIFSILKFSLKAIFFTFKKIYTLVFLPLKILISFIKFVFIKKIGGHPLIHICLIAAFILSVAIPQFKQYARRHSNHRAFQKVDCFLKNLVVATESPLLYTDQGEFAFPTYQFEICDNHELDRLADFITRCKSHHVQLLLFDGFVIGIRDKEQGEFVLTIRKDYIPLFSGQINENRKKLGSQGKVRVLPYKVLGFPGETYIATNYGLFSTLLDPSANNFRDQVLFIENIIKDKSLVDINYQCDDSDFCQILTLEEVMAPAPPTLPSSRSTPPTSSPTSPSAPPSFRKGELYTVVCDRCVGAYTMESYKWAINYGVDRDTMKLQIMINNGELIEISKGTKVFVEDSGPWNCWVKVRTVDNSNTFFTTCDALSMNWTVLSLNQPF